VEAKQVFSLLRNIFIPAFDNEFYDAYNDEAKTAEGLYT